MMKDMRKHFCRFLAGGFAALLLAGYASAGAQDWDPDAVIPQYTQMIAQNPSNAVAYQN